MKQRSQPFLSRGAIKKCCLRATLYIKKLLKGSSYFKVFLLTYIKKENLKVICYEIKSLVVSFYL